MTKETMEDKEKNREEKAKLALFRLMLLPKKHADYTKKDLALIRSKIVRELVQGKFPNVHTVTPAQKLERYKRIIELVRQITQKGKTK